MGAQLAQEASLDLGRIGFPQLLLVSDLDGVVNHPTGSQTPKGDIVGLLAHVPGNGGYLALATGRPLSWVEKHVLPIVIANTPVELRGHLLVTAENGTHCARVLPDGGLVRELSEAYRVPTRLRDAVRAIGDLSLGQLVYDQEKLVTASLFANPAPTDGAERFATWFNRNREHFAELLRTEVQDHGSSATFEVVATAIALDVQHSWCSKLLAAEQIMRWLRETGAASRVHGTLCIGDSPSDLDLAMGLRPYLSGKCALGFVGNESGFENVRSRWSGSVVHSQGYAEGARDLLSSLYSRLSA